MQVHGASVERAQAGQRVALNLVGDAVARWDVITSVEGSDPGGFAATYRVDVALEWIEPTATTARGSGCITGRARQRRRLIELGGRFFQLRLERPIVPLAGDRLVIRSLAPPDTLGGGRRARRHAEAARAVARSPGAARAAGAGRGRARTGAAGAAAGARASPARHPRARTGGAAARGRARAAARRGPGARWPRCASTAGRCGSGPTMHVHAEALAQVERLVIATIERDGEITLATLRDELKTSRKYAQAYLEHFDGAKLTLRRGDARVLRRRRA